MLRSFAVCLASLTSLAAGSPAWSETLTIEQFRQELIAVPLCGTPSTGALQGKELCVVHLPDGGVVVAGGGILARGVWEADGDKVCRRNPEDPLERRRCVIYERSASGQYKNSDGVEACIGPCAKPTHEPDKSTEKPAQ